MTIDRAIARRTVKCSLVVAVAFAALAAVAGAPAASAQELGADRRLFVIGDSVMVGAQGAVVTGLPSWQVTVVAEVGLSLLGSASIVRERRGEIGEVAVVELGANDGLDPAVFRQRVDAMMDALAGVPLVLWIDQPAFEAGRAALDAELTTAAAAHPTMRVVDWSAQVAAHPDYVGPDGLHLSAAGAQALTSSIGAELLRWVAEQTRPPSLFSVVGPYLRVAVHQVAETAPS